MPSRTRRAYALLRSNLASGSEADVAAAVSYGRQVKLYPLAAADHGPTTTYVDAAGMLFDSTIPSDIRFFEGLDRAVQAEPWLERDKAMIDVLKSLGIERGKRFAPDAATQEVLVDGLGEARAWLDMRYEALFEPPYFEGTHWALPVSKEFVEGIQTDYADPDEYAIDSRAVAYHFAFFSAKHLGAGQFYLLAINDAKGQPFDGSANYRLTVPADAPVSLYWSLTIYDRSTHALIRDMPWASRSSHSSGLRSNTDGSMDLHIGPVAPADGVENWIPSKAGGGFEALFRFYGPQKPLFDKSWRLPDVVRVD
jgi:hypothetical protein